MDPKKKLEEELAKARATNEPADNEMRVMAPAIMTIAFKCECGAEVWMDIPNKGRPGNGKCLECERQWGMTMQTFVKGAEDGDN